LTFPDLPRRRENTEGFIVITMTHNDTKILRWRSTTPRTNGLLWTGELDIDDITQQLSVSYPISEATLATALLDYGILIVTPSGVYLGDVSRQWGPQERIVQATIVESEVALVIYNEIGQWRLLTLQIMQNGSEISFQEYKSTILPREPTAIKLFLSSNSPAFETLIRRGNKTDEDIYLKYCFIALRYPPAIQIYGIDERSPPYRVYDLELTRGTFQEDPLASEIHSMELLLENTGRTYFLIGLRHGLVMNFHVEFWEQWNFFDDETTKLGESPVEFITSTYQRKDESRVFAMCEYLWEIRLENKELGIDEVVFDDFRMVRSLFCRC
jgi:hypothetical protein